MKMSVAVNKCYCNKGNNIDENNEVNDTGTTETTTDSGITSSSGPRRTEVNRIKIDEFLIGLALANVLAFAIQDFFVLLMYKNLGLKGQSLLSASIILLLALIALYVYLYLAPEGFNIL